MRRLTVVLIIMLLLTPALGSCRLLDRRVTRPTPTAHHARSQAASRPSETPTPEPTPDVATLEQTLHDVDWTLRLEAAWSLPDRVDLSAEQRVTLILDALQVPWDSAADVVPDHNYLPVSSVVRIELARALGELGAEAIPALRRAAAGGDEVGRECALLALGHLGQRDVIPQLREMLRDSYYVEVRMEAARVLGTLRASEAIPDLEAALNDPYFAYGSDSLGEYTLYPVREQAAGALDALGVDVERLEDDEFRVRRP
jgi:HEAT repeat protein